jgi:prenyltransferase beta subunit
VAADRLLTPRVERMVDKAHAYLIDHQNADGSFSIVRNDASTSAPVAVTSLAIMSLMASGHLPDRGSHRQAVQRAVDWLVAHCGEDGYFTTDGDKSEMHGQGYAVLALTQAYGMDAATAASATCCAPPSSAAWASSRRARARPTAGGTSRAAWPSTRAPSPSA